jgi:hypothetical protein
MSDGHEMSSESMPSRAVAKKSTTKRPDSITDRLQEQPQQLYPAVAERTQQPQGRIEVICRASFSLCLRLLSAPHQIVKVTSRQTVVQSLCQGIEPILGLVTRYYFLSEGCFLKVTVLSLWSALSDERSGLSKWKLLYTDCQSVSQCVKVSSPFWDL